MNISTKIKLLCAINNISPGELSKRMGDSRQNIYKKLSNKVFKTSDLENIARTLGCKVEINFVSQDGKKIV